MNATTVTTLFEFSDLGQIVADAREAAAAYGYGGGGDAA